MNFSIMTTSFPIDALTKQELQQLCQESFEIDRTDYELVLNVSMATDYMAKGFVVLVYNDETDTLVAAASAIDIMALNTYEWSLLVHPMYRQIGLGGALYVAMQKELASRAAAGQLALIMQNEGYGKTFISNQGFQYSFSEATLQAEAKHYDWDEHIKISPFKEADTMRLVQIFCEAFGDEEQEALDLIEYNSTHHELQLWVAELDGEIVGTVTTRKDGDAFWITALAVHPNAQGKGIGSALIYAVHHIALEAGAHAVKLDVELENERALTIYEKTGFWKIAQIDYYSKG